MTTFLDELLAEVVRTEGVRAALLIDAADGLVVAESSRLGIDSNTLAALGASLASRLSQAAKAMGHEPPTLMHLEATEGNLTLADTQNGLLIAVLSDPDTNSGLLRITVLSAVGQLGP